ncbi:eIF2 kinase Gcn2p negative regulator [Coniochaeta pulveracea]|uniref:eIF2 kinase Gcn2p negative regulator n=1 Tax=Coniochaeta pulveracea TaxID=177199 RepID=A0A420XXG7_9PEZI|nr:eIF2 kinase Gcn2p negative regulator [Coniochaeta pulveracea]
MPLPTDLQDEIEALNSIYGDSTLVPSTDDPESILILTPPCESASFRLQFSPSYPDSPPSVLGTHSIGHHAKPGQAARDLDVFRTAVATVYEPGQEQEAEDAPREDEPQAEMESPAEHILPPGQEPPWTLSLPLTENRSTFIARAAPVTSVAQAESYLQHLLATDKKVRTATHNITAWRIRGPNGTAFQDCDDDGETAAGGRLLHLMQLMDVWDAMVVVTRWYGGQKLGPRRFAVINIVARDALVRGGMVVEDQKGKKKGK